MTRMWRRVAARLWPRLSEGGGGVGSHPATLRGFVHPALDTFPLTTNASGDASCLAIMSARDKLSTQRRGMHSSTGLAASREPQRRAPEQEAGSLSFELEAVAQDVQDELNRLFNPRSPLQSASAAAPLSLPDREQSTHHGQGLRKPPAPPLRLWDVDDSEAPPKPFTHRPLRLTVEREHKPLMPPTAPVVPAVLRCSRWPSVRHQRYRDATPREGYEHAAGEFLAACEAYLISPRGRRQHLWEALQHVHSDAALCIIELLISRNPDPPLPHTPETSMLLLAMLWEVLSSPASGRALELSSKQVVWAVGLFEQSTAWLPGPSPSRLLPQSCLYQVLYVNRKNLRRRQNAACLRALLRHPPQQASAEEEQLYSSCLSHCVARCLEKAQPQDDIDDLAESLAVAHLLQSTLTLAWRWLDTDVRQAALRGALSRLRQQAVTSRAHSTILPSYLNAVMERTDESPPSVFRSMDRAVSSTDGFAVPSVDRQWLRPTSWPPLPARFEKHLGPTTQTAADAGGRPLMEGLSLPSSTPADSSFLAAAADVHQQLCALSHLPLALSSVDCVRHQFPLCAPTLLTKLLSLTQSPDGGEKRGNPPVGTAEVTMRQVLAACYQLFPHANVAEVVEHVVLTLAPVLEQRNAPAVQDALLRCLVYHVPRAQVPGVLSRVADRRELASCALCPLAIRLLKALVDNLPTESLPAEGEQAVSRLVEVEQKHTGLPLAVCLLLRDLQCSCTARQRHDQGKAATLGTAFSDASPTASRLPLLAEVQSRAIHELFGFSSAVVRSVMVPEVLAHCQSSLAWLYHVHRMSSSLYYEVSVLTMLANAQEAELRLSAEREHLVYLSEQPSDADWQGQFEAQETRRPSWLTERAPPTTSPTLSSQWMGRLPLPGTSDHSHRRCHRNPTEGLGEGNVEAEMYVTQLTQQASWRCLSFYLSATLLEQGREKPNEDFPRYAQEQLRRQLSLGDAAPGLIHCFFHASTGGSVAKGPVTTPGHEPVGGVPAAMRCSTADVPARQLLSLLRSYEGFLVQQSGGFPSKRAALLQWARYATCVCLVNALTAEGGDAAFTPVEFVSMYSHVLQVINEDNRAVAEDPEVTNGGHVRSAAEAAKSVRYPPTAPPPLPAALHEKAFALVCADPDLWRQALPLLEQATAAAAKAAAGSNEGVPASVYRHVMQSCLMYRVAVPEFIRGHVR